MYYLPTIRVLISINFKVDSSPTRGEREDSDMKKVEDSATNILHATEPNGSLRND